LVSVGLATGDRVPVATGVKVQDGLKTKVGTTPPEQPSVEGRKCSERTPAVRKAAPPKASEKPSEEGSKESERSNEKGIKSIVGLVAGGGKPSECGSAEGKEARNAEGGALETIRTADAGWATKSSPLNPVMPNAGNALKT
jgi:hypothetical protein